MRGVLVNVPQEHPFQDPGCSPEGPRRSARRPVCTSPGGHRARLPAPTLSRASAPPGCRPRTACPKVTRSLRSLPPGTRRLRFVGCQSWTSNRTSSEARTPESARWIFWQASGFQQPTGRRSARCGRPGAGGQVTCPAGRSGTPSPRPGSPGPRRGRPAGAPATTGKSAGWPRCTRFAELSKSGERWLFGRVGGPERRLEPLSCLAWRARQDSNLRPLAPEANALSSELRARPNSIIRRRAPPRNGGLPWGGGSTARGVDGSCTRRSSRAPCPTRDEPELSWRSTTGRSLRRWSTPCRNWTQTWAPDRGNARRVLQPPRARRRRSSVITRRRAAAYSWAISRRGRPKSCAS